MSLEVIILAAGKGTRMKSDKPKVLHTLAGKPMLEHVIDTGKALRAKKTHVIYGFGGDQVKTELGHMEVDWVEQAEQLGTGHAVQQVLPHLDSSNIALILYGDVPLISKTTLEKMVSAVSSEQMALLTIELDNPHGYGRIVRDSENKVVKIVEQKDASEAELAIHEINTGIMAVHVDKLVSWLSGLQNDNAQGEYYLTDIIEMAVDEGIHVEAIIAGSEIEVTGVNDKKQLQEMERAHQLQQAEKLMLDGVSLMDASRFDLRGNCIAGRDVHIDVNVIIEGHVELGNRVRVGANTVLRNVKIGDDVVIKENCVIEEAIVGQQSVIGPFARIRPETVLRDQTHIGNFVEIKKSTVGTGSKINHLSYIGDSEVGSKVNIGAGTITCNYDGANKYKTIIGDNAFIGSDSQLVAPVVIGKDATIGAGSTITRDTEEAKLTLSRSKQITIDSWQRPVKEKK